MSTVAIQPAARRDQSQRSRRGGRESDIAVATLQSPTDTPVMQAFRSHAEIRDRAFAEIDALGDCNDDTFNAKVGPSGKRKRKR